MRVQINPEFHPWEFVANASLVFAIISFMLHGTFIRKYYEDLSFRSSFKLICAFRSSLHMISACISMMTAIEKDGIYERRSTEFVIFFIPESLYCIYTTLEIVLSINRLSSVIHWRTYDIYFSYFNTHVLNIIQVILGIMFSIGAYVTSHGPGWVIFEVCFSSSVIVITCVLNSITVYFYIKIKKKNSSGNRIDIRPFLFSLCQLFLSVLGSCFYWFPIETSNKYEKYIYFQIGANIKDFVEGTVLLYLFRDQLFMNDNSEQESTLIKINALTPI